MQIPSTSRATGTRPWPQHASGATKKVPKESPAKGVARQSTQTRNIRAEAVVRHISQLPAFVAWASGNPAATPSLVEKYLDSQVAAVVAQLDPIHQAGNYERLILLLAELLEGDLAIGVTPHVVLCGVIDLMHSCVTAIAKGEVSIYEEKRKSGQAFCGSANPALLQSLRSPESTSAGTVHLTQPCSSVAPVESLLPPLVEQPSKLLKETRGDTEMEVWENYMATTRAAIVHATSCASPAHSCAAPLKPAALPFATPSAPLVTKCSLTDALCALIDRCTATPLVCLTLSDQQCQATAVRDLLRALVTIIQGIEGNVDATLDREITFSSTSSSSVRHNRVAATAAFDVQVVRLIALKGISRVLATYLEGTDAKAPQTLMLEVDDLDTLSLFEDVTHRWENILGVLASEEHIDREPVGAKENLRVNSECGELDSLASLPDRRNGDDSSNAAAQLHWILRIANQIIAAQRQQTSGGCTRATPRTRLLPPRLVTLALRTLSQISAASLPPCRAASYAQLCADVLWGASLLAPREASCQFVYGSMSPGGLAGASDGSSKSGSSISGRAEANPPAMDLFIGLLHQFNESHSTVHCELRDDLVCLFAFLLRHDIQYVEKELTARRAAQNGTQRMSLRSQCCPSTAIPVAEAHVTPLALSVATVEAINAVAALLFETTCGAELTTTAYGTAATNTAAAAALQSGGVDSDEAVPGSFLSIDAARRHALRFRSVATSVARRRELLDLKIYGWQLLDVHSSWQLAHLTYREYIRCHDTAAPAVGVAPVSQPQHTGPVEQETEKEASNDAVTATLWAIQLSQLGFVDVLLMYVDARTDEAAVMAWTQEERLQLELEAWQLLTSMILFAQELNDLSGGLQVRRHGESSQEPPAPEQQQQESSLPLRMSVEALGKEDFDKETGTCDKDIDDDNSGILCSADKHFIAAGGVQVALHYLFTAPAKAEAIKRWALVTLAAIARANTRREAQECSGNLEERELSFVQTVLAQHAPSLVPFLVQLIKEVDLYVDAAGVPEPVPPIISSVSASLSQTPSQSSEGHRCAREANNFGFAALPSVSGERWIWLPRSVAHTALVAWCLLRSIGDTVLEEARRMREASVPMIDDDDSSGEDDQSRDKVESSETLKSHSSTDTASTNRRESVERDRDSLRICALANPQPHNELAPSIPNLSSSESSLGYLVEGGKDVAEGGHSRLTEHSRATGSDASAAESLNDASAQECRSALLRCVDSEVLRIPELFAEQGGVGVLASWLRHVLRLCFSARPRPPPVPQSSRGASAAPQLTAEEVANLERYANTFLLLLDVLRANVMGCENNEMQFVESGGVHGILDLMEACALARGLIDKAFRHARLAVADSCSSAAAGIEGCKEQNDLLNYATTLLSDLLESCPRAIDAFFTWRSRHIVLSPLTPDVRECQLPSNDGIEAVQLLLCLWVSEMPVRETGSLPATPSISSGLMLLRFHLRPALRTALREEYVCRLLSRRAKLEVLQTDVIRNYYRYLHAEAAPGTASKTEDVPDAVVLAYMEKLVSRSGRNSFAAPEQQIPLVIYRALGLSMKVYGCLSTVGFDSLCAAEAETLEAPSMGVRLSSLERSLLIQVAALPALCVDEISAAMAEVALEGQHLLDDEVNPVGSDAGDHASDASTAWRPTTPDRRVLCTAAEEAGVRGKEIYQLIELGVQVQKARNSQLFNRFLVSQLRQPVGQPADGRPGAVRGLWKTQRRLSFTRGSALVLDSDKAVPSAAELSARLSTRLAAEQQQQQQQLIASTVCVPPHLDGTQTKGSVGEAQSTAKQLGDPLALLGSSRTPYPSLMNTIDAATHGQRFAMSFSVVAPPRRPAVPLTQRHKQRQAMIARSLRRFSQDKSTPQSPHDP
ncbi:hypothetical protein JKF63_01651 [Porcisia hertigi]|uniref:Uncharacterized protein n=1 Tax=Porcisia hertigi TaxID=2761500 RepID=A0A836L0K5_9TRYP|nr:hypothetical protein JKF63_01651 [Porcisia hertigi]